MAMMQETYTIPSRPQAGVYTGDVELVLLDLGSDPAAVCETMGELLGLHVSDPDALEAALPLRVFASVPIEMAREYQKSLVEAGASLEARLPRSHSQGLAARSTH